jgi:formate dehydrogenase (coenzyme F420) beta subunit
MNTAQGNMQNIRDEAAKQLRAGEVAGVLACRVVGGHPVPFLFRNPEECAGLVAPEDDRYPLTKILCRLADRHPEEALGVVVRGCQERSLIELFKNHQLDPEKVKPIAVSCTGEQAERCRCSRPYPRDAAEGERARPVEDLADLKEVEDLPEAERLRFWMRQFGKCIKCYGCRNICPACFCTRCTLEDSALVFPGEMPPEIPIFHLIKAFHMADRCIDCGLCEEACPMGIPVRRLYRKVSRAVKDLFGYVPGEKADDSGPLEFLGDGSYEPPAPGRK